MSFALLSESTFVDWKKLNLLFGSLFAGLLLIEARVEEGYCRSVFFLGRFSGSFWVLSFLEFVIYYFKYDSVYVNCSSRTAINFFEANKFNQIGSDSKGLKYEKQPSRNK